MNNHIYLPTVWSLFLSLLLTPSWGQPVPSQSPPPLPDQLQLGTRVDINDPKYRDIADAVVLFQRGNADGALNLLKTAHQKNPELAPGTILFAHLCFASNNVKPGRDVLQLAAIETPDDPEVWNMLADLQLREGHLAEAALIFEKGIEVAQKFEQNPQRKTAQLANAYAGAAMAYERRNQWSAAEPYLQAWQKLSPETNEVYSRLAAVLINTERYDEALTTLQELNQRDPNQLPAAITLGLTYERLGKREEAKASLEAGLAEHADDFNSQIAVGRWYLTVGEIDLARKCAQSAQELKADSEVPALMLAQADYLDQKYAEAEAAFQKIYQTRPSNFDATNGLALSMLAQNDAAKSKMALEYAELLAKSNTDLRTARGVQAAGLLAWAMHHNENREQAAQLMVSLLNNVSVSAEQRYFAAVIFNDLGRGGIAKQLLQQAVESNTHFANYYDAKVLLDSIE